MYCRCSGASAVARLAQYRLAGGANGGKKHFARLFVTALDQILHGFGCQPITAQQSQSQ